MYRKNNYGFTLVEIAIVLVVAGLLIGAVLKGRELIVNSKLKRIESDSAAILVSMFSYQDRYLQYPGDDNKANSRFDTYKTLDPDNVNGNGTGTIEGAWDASNTNSLYQPGAVETEKFFAHLRAANLISGSGKDTTQLPSAYNGKIGIQDNALLISGHVAVFGYLDGVIAKILESRLDDGNPQSGRIQADKIQNQFPSGTVSTSSIYEDSSIYTVALRL